MTTLSDIHQFCAKGFYEIQTTYQCPSLSFHLPSLLVEGTGCPFLICVLWTRVSLALLLRWVRRSRVSLVLLLKFLLYFDSIPIGGSK